MVNLSALVSDLDAELVRLGYKGSTMIWYRGCWRRLERFFAAHGEEEFSRVLAIPAKKQTHPNVNYLTVEQTRRLLAQPDRSTRRGRRDATLLATLYDTAARVQELADLTVRDIRLEHPALAALTGKGRRPGTSP